MKANIICPFCGSDKLWGGGKNFTLMLGKDMRIFKDTCKVCGLGFSLHLSNNAWEVLKKNEDKIKA